LWQTKASKYAVRENKCKARHFAPQKKADSDVTQSADGDDVLNAIARKYLDLWLEHWSSSLSAPETAAAMTRLLAASATAPGSGFAGIDGIARWFGAADEPAALRTAPNAGDGRVDELEKRIAALERRLAELEGRPGSAARDEKSDMAGPAGRPRRRARKI
jgi:hypothetical protein